MKYMTSLNDFRATTEVPAMEGDEEKSHVGLQTAEH